MTKPEHYMMRVLNVAGFINVSIDSEHEGLRRRLLDDMEKRGIVWSERTHSKTLTYYLVTPSIKKV